MISKTEKERLKEILGEHYSILVSAELKTKGITTKNGDQHSLDFIRRVMNGKSHKAIETAIYSAAETAVAKKLKEAAKRETILKSA